MSSQLVRAHSTRIVTGSRKLNSIPTEHPPSSSASPNVSSALCRHPSKTLTHHSVQILLEIMAVDYWHRCLCLRFAVSKRVGRAERRMDRYVMNSVEKLSRLTHPPGCTQPLAFNAERFLADAFPSRPQTLSFIRQHLLARSRVTRFEQSGNPAAGTRKRFTTQEIVFGKIVDSVYSRPGTIYLFTKDCFPGAYIVRTRVAASMQA